MLACTPILAHLPWSREAVDSQGRQEHIFSVCCNMQLVVRGVCSGLHRGRRLLACVQHVHHASKAHAYAPAHEQVPTVTLF